MMRSVIMLILFTLGMLSAGMKVTVKTVTGTSFEVEAAPEEKVKDLKTKIAAAKPEVGPTDTMKILCAGKVLQDDSTLQAGGVQSGGFVVVMSSKKATAAAPAPAPTPAVAQTPAAAAPAVVVATTTIPNELSTLGEAVKQMINMGHDRAQVERCLQAAFRDPDAAMKYLTSSGCLPTTTVAPMAATTVVSATTIEAGAVNPVVGSRPQASSAGSGANALAGLRGSPEFEQLASQLSQAGSNAEMQQMLTAMAQANPQMFQALQQNPQALMELLNSQGGGEGQEGGAAAAAQPGVISVSPQEKEAIDRLVALTGVDESTAAQAYFACDKNEELAANFLFDQRDSANLIRPRQSQTHSLENVIVIASACVMLTLISLKRFRSSQKRGQQMQEPFLSA